MWDNINKMKSLTEIKGVSIPSDLRETLMRTDRNKVVVNVENIVRIFNMIPEFSETMRFDKWKDKAYIKEGGVWRDFNDGDYLILQRKLSQALPEFSTVTKYNVIDAVDSFMWENATDSALEYFRGLTWDKEDRICNFMQAVYGCPDDAYHRAVGENFLKGIAARVVNPGVKFDTVLCIEGAQGLGKSTSLSILAGGMNHLETMVDPESKDFLMQMKGNLIVEFTEGVIMNKKDAANMKGFVSKQCDTFRNPFGRTVNDVKRRCVFAMTTNSTEYLKDSTGNRRFMPIYAERIDLDWLRDFRDQLLAEALYRYEVLGENIHVYPRDAKQHQDAKIISTPHVGIIEEWSNSPFRAEIDGNPTNFKRIDKNGGFTTMDVWVNAMQNRIGALKKWEEVEVEDTLKRIGFELRGRRWYRIEKIDVLDKSDIL